MPTYELAAIIKALQRPELAQVIKRCCTNILDNGGIIRGLENLGAKPLPYRMKCHGTNHFEGNYILIRFDGSAVILKQLHDVFKRDMDVIKKSIFADEKFVPPCQSGPCQFGEISNPDHEKRLWWAKVTRRHGRAEKKKALSKQ